MAEKVVLLAREFRSRLSSLVANWIGVGYSQGNFNTANPRIDLSVSANSRYIWQLNSKGDARLLPGDCRLASQCFAFIWRLLAAASGWSLERLLVLDEGMAQPLDRFVSLLRDPGGELTFEQVRSGTEPEPFRPAEPGGLHQGYTPDVYWMRIEVESRSSTRLDRMLEFTYAYLDDISLYRVNINGTVERMRSGRTVAPADRVVAHRKPSAVFVVCV